MGRHASTATQHAFKLLKNGKVTRVAEAARRAGIHRNTLYKYQPFVDWKAQQKKENQHGQ